MSIFSRDRHIYSFDQLNAYVDLHHGSVDGWLFDNQYNYEYAILHNFKKIPTGLYIKENPELTVVDYYPDVNDIYCSKMQITEERLMTESMYLVVRSRHYISN